MATLDKAITLAVNAHSGQTDKAGAPYILHVMRVLLAQTEQDSRTVAALHDVVEDSPLTLDDLRYAGFSANVVEAVDAMTRREGEEYFAFVQRSLANALARSVKVADLRDNLRQSQDAGDAERSGRYLHALKMAGEDL